LKRGDSFFCIFDAVTRFKLEKRSKGERGIYEHLLWRYSHYFGEVTGGTNADDFLLPHANESGNPIITNDKFKQYERKYRWLETEPQKLLKGGMMGGFLTIPKLGIHLKVSFNLKDTADEFEEQAVKRSQPAI
jgi:hypothetical protein